MNADDVLENHTPPPVNSTDVTYVKVNRKTQTIFVECNETETVEMLKAKIVRFFPNDTKLYQKGLMLDEGATLYQQNVKNGAELWVITKANAFDNAWETLEEAGYHEPKGG